MSKKDRRVRLRYEGRCAVCGEKGTREHPIRVHHAYQRRDHGTNMDRHNEENKIPVHDHAFPGSCHEIIEYLSPEDALAFEALNSIYVVERMMMEKEP